MFTCTYLNILQPQMGPFLNFEWGHRGGGGATDLGRGEHAVNILSNNRFLFITMIFMFYFLNK